MWQLDPDRWLHSLKKVSNEDPYEAKPVVMGGTHLVRATSEGLAVWELATSQPVVLPGNTEAVVGYAHAAAEARVIAVTSRGELKT